MKELIFKNKKIVCVGLVSLSILFVILAVLNLGGKKRKAYQSMYDANHAMYSTYIEYAEKYEGYGYSSEAQEMYSKANGLKGKLDKYKGELTSLNIQMGLFAILAIGSGGGVIWVWKNDNANVLEKISEPENNQIEEDKQ